MTFIKSALILLVFSFSDSAFADTINFCKEGFDIESLSSHMNDLKKADYIKSKLVEDKKFLVSSRRQRYELFYNKCLTNISQKEITMLNGMELHKLFNLVLHVNFYSPNDRLKEIMFKIISLKESKNEYVENLVLMLHEAYIRSRALPAAQSLELNYPKILFPETLSIIDINANFKRSVLELTPDRSVLIRKNVDIPNGGFVLIISSPMCSPSNRFINWISNEGDQEVISILKKHSMLLNPTSSQWHIDKLINVNSQIKPLKMYHSFDRDEWPEVTLWETPTFYFFKDKKLVSQKVGWKSDNDREELYVHLRGVALL